MDMDQSTQDDSQCVNMDTGHVDFGASGGFSCTVDVKRDNSGKDASKLKHGRLEPSALPAMSPGKVDSSSSMATADGFNMGGELGLKQSLLDDVLSDKKMALMRTPEVMRFLQAQQANIVMEKKQIVHTSDDITETNRGDQS